MTKEDRTMGGSRDRRISEFQMPILPDPGKGDDLGSEPLDFSVRLGSTLARGLESESRKISRDHSFPSRRRSSCLILPIPERRISTILSPISPKDGDIPGSRSGAKVSRGRRESRRHSNNRTSTVANIYVTTIETARMRIHRIFRAVRIISGICLALKRYVKACETKTWSFMEMYLHVKEDLSQCVAFNPHSFSRVEPERHKLRKLLAIDGPDRTNGDVKVILALLRDNTSFQDYPFHVQYQLARCMSYQSYEARRVILKQGHRPEAFYILLSGSVMANIEDVSPESGKQFVKTVKEMGPGETFGEVALIEGGRRTASIVCKTNVELLVILKHDFDNIIREPLVEQIDEHLEFCRTMALFQDFPCDTLAENPSQFFYHFFKKGDIVVRDSRVSKYIIVVKAGKCKVVCTYTESHRKKGRPGGPRGTDMQAAFPHWDDMEKIRAKHRHTKSPAERTRETICLGLLTGQIDRNRLADHGPDVQRPKTSAPAKDTYKNKPPPLKKSKTLGNFFDDIKNIRKDKHVTDEDLYNDFTGDYWSKRLQYIKKSTLPGSRISGRTPSPTRKRSGNPFYAVEKPVFAQLAVLGTGTVFGLESLVQKPSCTTSLVSEGAECIFISKRLFLQLANIKVLRVVTDMVQNYPSQDFIQEQVKSYRTWQKYKKTLVQDVLDRMH
ncbi:uncharacterized protein LOC128228758 [Mya arenaria]|uniref:uncharacterized protein LOC128228758 n=1 Tax=Mya arenaria TaxID=6604 RepID=UPI0022E3A214|nr:uncharacterized protein LOC128228758 [Mya arenaria]